jgi:hypothetical protein
MAPTSGLLWQVHLRSFVIETFDIQHRRILTDSPNLANKKIKEK